MALNLTRAWRSRTFDEMIGQELAVKMLKNSLYRSQFFPVYLFSGQHGCGKTTAARIFASAVNCQKLSDFQQNPHNVLPCLACDSCRMMAQGAHPDFFEIDAASHTGVDHVRDIIDAASLLPVAGQYKIYLIDEAHMLSKAAFNAFLKILEEPPKGVLFILATTEAHKIIDTIVSRCFQVWFRPVERTVITQHLAMICSHEKLTYEEEALLLIAQQSHGSVRDALNMLEQVRFASDEITKQAVYALTAHMAYEDGVLFLDYILHKPLQELIGYMQTICLSDYMPLPVWYMLQEIMHDALVITCQAVPEELKEKHKYLQKIFKQHTLQELTTYLHCMYQYEPHMLKISTEQQKKLLRFVLLMLNEQSQGGFGRGAQSISKLEVAVENIEEQLVHKYAVKEEEPPHAEISQEKHESSQSWQTFLQSIGSLDDPLVMSVFKQARFIRFEESSSRVYVGFAPHMTFFKDLLGNVKESWHAVFKTVFGSSAILEASFDEQNSIREQVVASEVPVLKKLQQQRAPVLEVPKKPNAYQQQKSSARIKEDQRKGAVLSKVNKESWPKAHQVLTYFPGVLTQLAEDIHE